MNRRHDVRMFLGIVAWLLVPAAELAAQSSLLPLQITVDPGTARCAAENFNVFPTQTVESQTSDGSQVVCGLQPTSTVAPLMIMGAPGPGPFSALGAATIYDFMGHGSAAGVSGIYNDGFTAGVIRVSNRRITVSNPNAIDVGIVVNQMEWGEGTNSAVAFGHRNTTAYSTTHGARLSRRFSSAFRS